MDFVHFPDNPRPWGCDPRSKRDHIAPRILHIDTYIVVAFNLDAVNFELRIAFGDFNHAGGSAIRALVAAIGTSPGSALSICENSSPESAP
jgi:hypothetical protein